MSDNNYNELDKFFRSKLKTETPADDLWNVPSMEVLDNALDHIKNSKRKKPRIFPFLLIFAMILLGSMTMIFYPNQEVNQASPSLTEQNKNVAAIPNQNIETVVKPIDEEELHKQNKRTEANNMKAPKKLVIKETTISTPSKTAATKSNINNSNVINIDNTLIHNKDKTEDRQKQNHIIIPVANAKSIEASESNISNSSSKIQNIEIAQIGSLELTPFLTQDREFYAPNMGLVKLLVRDKKQNNFAARVFAGMGFTSLNMTNLSDQSFSLTGYDNFYNSYQFGIGLRYSFSDSWTAVSNTSYVLTNNKSLYESTMGFHPDLPECYLGQNP